MRAMNGAQRCGRAAVGQDAGRRRRRDGYIWTDGVASRGGERARGRGRAAAWSRAPRSNSTDKKYGRTALHLAAMNGHRDVAALLLERMDKALIAAKSNNGRTALHHAAMNGHEDVVALLLDRRQGGDVAATDKDGRTTLHLAAENGHVYVVRSLLQAGAEVDSKSNNGRTALHHAAENGHGDVVALLLGRMEGAFDRRDG